MTIWRNGNIDEWHGKRESLNFGALNLLSDCMSEWSASLRGFPWRPWAEGRGSRSSGAGKPALKTWKTDFERFVVLAAVMTAHAPSLMSIGISCEKGFYYLPLPSPFWNSWAALLSNTLSHCPHKHTHTCQTMYGDHGLAVMGTVSRAPRFHFPDSSWQGGSSLWALPASVWRQGQLWQPPTPLCEEGMLFRILCCWFLCLQCHHTSFMLFN